MEYDGGRHGILQPQHVYGYCGKSKNEESRLSDNAAGFVPR
jgi:hypothetical protein